MKNQYTTTTAAKQKAFNKETTRLSDKQKQLKEQYTTTAAAKQKAFNKETTRLKESHKQELLSVRRELPQLQSAIFKSDRKYDKTITLQNTTIATLNLKLNTLKAENNNTVSDVSKKVATAVKIAVKEARLKEITHQLKDRGLLKESLGNKCVEQQCKVASLQMKLIQAERNAHNSSKKATTQQSNSLDIVKNMNITLANNKELEERE